MIFREWLLKNSFGEPLRHARRKKFPRTNNHKSIRAYLNSKYKGKYLDDDLIEAFNRLLDEFEEEQSLRIWEVEAVTLEECKQLVI